MQNKKINELSTELTPDLSDLLPIGDPTSGALKKITVQNLATFLSAGGGTVNSVAMTVPTGLTVSGSPITSTGTLAVSFDTGYSIPTTADQTNWSTAYGWGDHGAAGYLTTAAAASTYQPLDADLTAIAALTGTGFLKRTGVNTWSLDTNTYLTAETDPVYTASSWYTTTNNSSNWDTAYGWGNHASAGYITGNQTITLSGDVTGSGATAITTTIASQAVTYAKIQNVAANSFLANVTGSAASLTEIATDRIPLFGSAITGTPSASTFLRGDGTWSSTGFISSLGVSGSPQTGASQVLAVGTTGTNVNWTSSGNTHTLNVPDASQTARGLVTTGLQLFEGYKWFYGAVNFQNVVYMPNNHFDTQSSAPANTNGAGFLFGSYTTAAYKNVFNYTYNGYQLTNEPLRVLSTNLFKHSNYIAPTTGSYGMVSNMLIHGVEITASTGVVDIAAALVIARATTGATDNYGIYVKDGTVRFDGALELQGIPSATKSDVLYYDSTTKRVSYGAAPAGGAGTVTSVALSAPVGFAVTGSPVTTSGTLALAFDTGYSLPLTSSQTNWDTAYGWGNHASAGYITGNQTITLSGDVTGSGATAITTTIAAQAVTYAKIQNVAANSFLANVTGSSASLTEIATNRIPLFGSAITGTPSASTYLRGDGTWASPAGAGTVTSVAMSVPTGFAVSGSPITSSGTLAVTFDTGYSLPLTSSQTNWDTAYGWGNHASAGYLTSATAASTYQPLDADLTAIAALSGSTGFLTKTGANTWVIDTNTYLTGNQSITLSGDVTGSGATAITTTIAAQAVTYAKIQNVAANSFLANLTGSAASLTEVATNRIPLFSSAITGTPSASTYLRGDGSWQTISGSGTVTSVAMTVPTGFAISGSPITSSGTLAVTFDTGYSLPLTSSQTNWDTAYGWGNHASAGYLTSATAASTYQPLDADLTAIAGLAGTSGLLQKTGANTWALDTNTYLTSVTTLYNGDGSLSGNRAVTMTTNNLTFTATTGLTTFAASPATNGNVFLIKNNNSAGNTNACLALDLATANPVDIRLGSSTPTGIRMYCSNVDLTSTPTGAGFQMFSNANGSFPGQVYFDSGAHNSAAIYFRTAAGGGTITTRVSISATGSVTMASLSGSGTRMVVADSSGVLSTQSIPISRSINSISSPTTAGATASTDYVYLVSGTTTLTLPTAVSNTNMYTIKNSGVNTVTIATTSSQTIDGSTTITLPVANTSVSVVSNGSNWFII